MPHTKHCKSIKQTNKMIPRMLRELKSLRSTLDGRYWTTVGRKSSRRVGAWRGASQTSTRQAKLCREKSHVQEPDSYDMLASFMTEDAANNDDALIEVENQVWECFKCKQFNRNEESCCVHTFEGFPCTSRPRSALSTWGSFFAKVRMPLSLSISQYHSVTLYAKINNHYFVFYFKASV